MKKLYALFIILIIAGWLTGTHAATRDSVSVHFRVSHTRLDPNFADNNAALDSIFDLLKSDSLSHSLTAVKVRGGASPEGSVKFNEYLSRKRAEAIFDAFRNRGFVTDSTYTEFTYLGRDWAGLRDMVAADAAVPARAEVLELLDTIVDGTRAPEHPLARLKGIGGGTSYLYMYRRMFPQLRESSLLLEYAPLFQPIEPLEEVEQPRVDIALIVPEPELTIAAPAVPVRCRSFYMGLKTNLLYDALALPNIGAEFYIGKNWTLTADWLYGWWDRDSSHRYWRAYGGWLGARKWFGSRANEKPLTGHHLGAFAGVITYDFEFGGTGVMGGIPGRTLWDRCNFICGLEYGYSLPIARRLNLDFSIALGYIGGRYYKYVPRDGYYQWQSTHSLRWIGPTKAEIALVWLIGCDNYNRKK